MKKTALIIVDVQKGFDSPVWGERNNLNAEGNISKLLQHWRSQEFPIVHIQHSSNEPDSPLCPTSAGFAFKDDVKPLEDEVVFQKSVNSAFIGTELEAHLREHQIKKVVFVGLTTNHCVSTSCRMAANLGFETFVVIDATAAFARNGIDGFTHSAQIIHDISLANLHGEFATAVRTSELLNL